MSQAIKPEIRAFHTEFRACKPKRGLTKKQCDIPPAGAEGDGGTTDPCVCPDCGQPMDPGCQECPNCGSEELVQIGGHAAVFNVLSEDLGGWKETIDPAAFDSCMGDDVRCYINHDRNLLLGRVKAGTLRISKDDVGLVYECDLPDTDYAEGLAELMMRGDVDQSSFAFTVADATWETRDGIDVRVIKRVARIFDVSPVTEPAYTAADVGIRSAQEILATRPAKTEPGYSTELARMALDLSLSL